MIKICLLSDSHGSRNKVEDLITSSNFDYVFFMGDGVRDFEYIDSTILKKVCGNCDFFCDEPITQFANFEGFKIMLTQGHDFKAKLTRGLMLEKAKQNYCDIVCYGHTHTQKSEKYDGILFINPGAFKNGEYALLTLNKNKEPNIEFVSYNK